MVLINNQLFELNKSFAFMVYKYDDSMEKWEFAGIIMAYQNNALL